MKRELKIKGISHRYLRLAATYRRFAGRDRNYDWSKEALEECFLHESEGEPASKMNGYVYGKWCKDINVSNWIEDIQKGNFCKAEFYTTMNKWWLEKVFNSVASPTWFPFSKELDINGEQYRKAVEDRMNY